MVKWATLEFLIKMCKNLAKNGHSIWEFINGMERKKTQLENIKLCPYLEPVKEVTQRCGKKLHFGSPVGILGASIFGKKWSLKIRKHVNAPSILPIRGIRGHSRM